MTTSDFASSLAGTPALHATHATQGTPQGRASESKEQDMNDMKEKAMGAVKVFLERKGYEIVDEAWQGPEGIGGIDLVAVDEDGTLVFVDATVRIGTDGFPEAHRVRGLREALAATWLAGNGDDYADTPVRFDEVAMMVVKENRALLRHHVNCFGEMEPLS